eukprot:CAMPEP_0119309408 /NCGR_PEP_ID=MMETSP1333-20130426/15350_1 /TAXON_ID=418940 /ORGANISM="Scyphosphaera apsteinii, Strain RCC1455" /LENGTH=294 /DNA_ID=CAMNT_0007313375 /DNA_START=10 /DNA_END=894 /DNA_ORIENTATION=+
MRRAPLLSIVLVAGLVACDKGVSAPAAPRKTVDTPSAIEDECTLPHPSEDIAIDENVDENDPISTSEPDVTAAVPPSLSLLSKRAMSKLAPWRAKVLRVLKGQDMMPQITGEVETDSADTDGEQPVQKRQPAVMMILMICARLVVSLLLVWLQRRKGGEEGATSASTGMFKGIMDAFGNGPLGALGTALQRGSARIATFARSPNAAPVMLMLLILVTKLIKQIDLGAQHWHTSATAEELDSEEAANEEQATAAELDSAEAANEEQEDEETAASEPTAAVEESTETGATEETSRE